MSAFSFGFNERKVLKLVKYYNCNCCIEKKNVLILLLAHAYCYPTSTTSYCAIAIFGLPCIYFQVKLHTSAKPTITTKQLQRYVYTNKLGGTIQNIIAQYAIFHRCPLFTTVFAAIRREQTVQSLVHYYSAVRLRISKAYFMQ